MQGVFFRQSTADTARRLGIDGWVRNCADGSVEGCAHGAAESLDALRRWLHEGPPAARVERVEWSESSETVQRGFIVHR